MKLKIIVASAALALAAPLLPQQAGPLGQTLHYGVEWRLIRAGIARYTAAQTPAGLYQGDLHLESVGLVSKLHRVNDDYRANWGKDFCGTEVVFRSEEGKRKRDTRITFDGKSKASYLERDLVKNNIVLAKDLETPACVHDYIAGLAKLRTLKMEPGQSTTVPLTDGKKFAAVKVDAQEREQVKTPAGSFTAVRHEIYMFNGTILNRKARMHVWISEDARRLPVKLQVRLSVLVGTITLELEKIE